MTVECQHCKEWGKEYVFIKKKLPKQRIGRMYCCEKCFQAKKDGKDPEHDGNCPTISDEKYEQVTKKAKLMLDLMALQDGRHEPYY